ncbi:Resistance protein [Corchorus olitorius]|uniref:Resistance protein n=1 Tax=Corchorus olitorius TaxID=93759 RepID=A0A1R3FXI6_9ROSI|nr:Resistance protein [Corchorus olitorius]
MFPANGFCHFLPPVLHQIRSIPCCFSLERLNLIIRSLATMALGACIDLQIMIVLPDRSLANIDAPNQFLPCFLSMSIKTIQLPSLRFGCLELRKANAASVARFPTTSQNLWYNIPGFPSTPVAFRGAIWKAASLTSSAPKGLLSTSL